jgi:hypothetical protein
MQTDRNDMLVPKHPELEPAARQAYRAISDVLPAAAATSPALLSIMADIELINALLSTIAGVLGIIYLIFKIYRLRKGTDAE